MTDLETENCEPEKIPEKSVLTEYERAATMLQDFGLSESETAVYITLLEAGLFSGSQFSVSKSVIDIYTVYQLMAFCKVK